MPCSVMMNRGAVVLWFDNFARFLAVNNPTRTEDGKTLRTLKWTVMGAKYLSNEAVDQCSLTIDGECSPVLSVDENVFSNLLFDRCSAALAQALYHSSVESCCGNDISKYYDASLVRRYKVDVVPLKLLCTTNLPAKAQEALSTNAVGLRDFFPAGVIDADPATNKGLFDVLTKVHEVSSKNLSKLYLIMVDQNLYVRLAKVCI